jgi:hypothetical protein
LMVGVCFGFEPREPRADRGEEWWVFSSTVAKHSSVRFLPRPSGK